MAIASSRRMRARDSAKTQSVDVPPLRSRPAWALLEKHYQKLRSVHLRQLFADDRQRGTAIGDRGGGNLSRLLQEPNHRRDTASIVSARKGISTTPAHRCDVPRRQDQCLGKPRCAACRAAGAARRYDSFTMGATWFQTFTPSWTGWRIFPNACAAATGRARPASVSAM